MASIVLSVAFLLIGLPSPIALGVSAGILSQLIPVVGTFLGGLVPFIASISLGTTNYLSTILVLLIYQVIVKLFYKSLNYKDSFMHFFLDFVLKTSYSVYVIERKETK